MLLPPVVNEMFRILNLFMDEIKDNIQNVKFAEPGYFTFELFGKKYRAKDYPYALGISINSDKAIALKKLINGGAKEIG